MAVFEPDYQLEQALKLIKGLSDSKKNELIKYLYRKQQETIAEQDKELKEYRLWFQALSRFLPNKNPVF